jgi:hypothetical protein
MPTPPQVYDIVGTNMTLTRVTSGASPASSEALYNSSLESSWDGATYVSPSGSEWSSGYVSTYPLVFDAVDNGLILTRLNGLNVGAGGGLFNTASELGYSSSTSPAGTEWSSGYVSAYPLFLDTVDTGLILTARSGSDLSGLFNSASENSSSNATPSGTLWSSGRISNYPLVLDVVDTGLILTRAVSGAGGGLFNTASEAAWFNPVSPNPADYTSPTGSRWNSIYVDQLNYAWYDLSNVTTRTYGTLTEALDFNIGRNIVDTELVMHDIINDKYYKFDVTRWGQGGDGTYAYTRQLIDTGSGTLTGSPITVSQSFFNTLTDITTRTYGSFLDAVSYNPLLRADNTELIMYDTINGKYYKFVISKWGGDTLYWFDGTYAYARQLIDTGSGTLTGSVTTVTQSFYNTLNDVTTRTYSTFRSAFKNNVGEVAVDTELIMHDTINDKYYKFDITQWGQGGVGTYAYTRQLIDTGSGTLTGSAITVTQSFFNTLTGVTTRTYDTFYTALDSDVGQNAVSTELIMHDTINDKYYKFDITQWGNDSQGTIFAYNRQEINTITNQLTGSVVYVQWPEAPTPTPPPIPITKKSLYMYPFASGSLYVASYAVTSSYATSARLADTATSASTADLILTPRSGSLGTSICLLTTSQYQILSSSLELPTPLTETCVFT